MTTLTLTTRTFQAAPLGPENRLPSVAPSADGYNAIDTSAGDDELRRNAAYGKVATVAPYLQQDGYGRELEASDLAVVVLENDHLRAEFLPELGGRLWSLVDKASGAELLFTGDEIRLANFALRNAWFAGGAEWNIGTIGHTPTSCARLHAVSLTHPDGTPMLRMYEYERLRGVVFQIDVHLPVDATQLSVAVRIVNHTGTEVPMYWWSNIAVPQTAGTRVIVPADRAWRTASDRTVRNAAYQEAGHDHSYPARAAEASDYFFQLDDGALPWIAAVEPDGTGLVQTSSARLRGRKQFVWGATAGGARWQEWLSGPGREYLEIQAGLARTQLEHLPMPAGATWSWVETYGRLVIDPAAVAGEYPAARVVVTAAVEALAAPNPPAAQLAEADALGVWDLAPERVLVAGSGWGALAQRLGVHAGQRAGADAGAAPAGGVPAHTPHHLSTPGTPFDALQLGAEQQLWVDLLDGRAPNFEPGELPLAYEADARWLPLLAAHDTWQAWALAGVIHAALNDADAAREAWERSIAFTPNVLALRCLGATAGRAGDAATAADRYEQALALAPTQPNLFIEALGALNAAGRADRVRALVAAAPAALAALGRVQVALVVAALDLDDCDEARARLLDCEVPDLREGDLLLSDLWARLQQARVAAGLRAEALPRHLDFTMFGG
ncbi:MAG TPA: DUF5107 domain-containing protein [Candidatus Lumbricidophila sp.]|nr:DUF5107 domain-containing protein [Candidatus Lumbricidophila sp.]